MNDPLHVRRIHSLRSLRWLARGWADFAAAPLIGLAHGSLVAAFGGMLLWVGWTHFWALAGAFSGFLLVAPLISTGLYAVSRAITQGEAPTWAVVRRVWLSLDRRLVFFGVLLMGQGTVWVMTSAALIRVWAHAPVATPEEFVRNVVLSAEPGLFETWLLFGGLLAAPLFASTLVTIPLLMDRPGVSVVQAMNTSLRAVATNPVLCSLWAGILMLLTLVGFASMMFLLIVVLPVLGHASWHAYRDLVVRDSGAGK
jgi:uncharacterized membrane protein